MGMHIASLGFVDFRSFEEYKLDEVGLLTILVGQNGVGKTNVLEGICLMTSMRSFRHSQISQIIRQGKTAARIKSHMTDGSRDLEMALLLEPGKKRYTVNGKVKSPADIRGSFPAVSFIPDDLEIAKRSSSVKRNALDGLGVQISKNYHVVHGDFEKSLRYKNRLLKEEAPQPLVDAMNETFLTCATQLYCYRHALYRKIMPLVEKWYGEIARSGELFGASYLPSWDYLNNGERDPQMAGFDGGENPNKDLVREKLEKAVECFGEDERRRRRSLVGPHNDKIGFYLAGENASDYASQGQQRSIVLSWKLAEVELIRQTLGTNPILLLDDVMSELDESRREMLVKSVGRETQTFITSTDLSPFSEELLSRARIVKLA